jgi:hypothetical protein
MLANFCHVASRVWKSENVSEIGVNSKGSQSHRNADIKTISKFAQLEFKLGDPERGRTVFEGILSWHLKRWDIWSIYMDMEAGQSDIQNLR